MEKARKNSITSGGCPRRKLILQTGTLNFRPPVNRSKSAPRLGSIDEEDEQLEIDENHNVEEECDVTSVSDFEYDEVSVLLLGCLLSTNLDIRSGFPQLPKHPTSR